MDHTGQKLLSDVALKRRQNQPGSGRFERKTDTKIDRASSLIFVSEKTLAMFQVPSVDY